MSINIVDRGEWKNQMSNGMIAALNDLRDRCHANAVKHGFIGARIGEEIALMHSELSEALEEYRNGSHPSTLGHIHDSENKNCPINHDESNELNCKCKPVGIPSEMADTLIRIMDFCGKYSINIGQAVIDKMEYNESRPFRHGGKKL